MLSNVLAYIDMLLSIWSSLTSRIPKRMMKPLDDRAYDNLQIFNYRKLRKGHLFMMPGPIASHPHKIHHNHKSLHHYINEGSGSREDVM